MKIVHRPFLCLLLTFISLLLSAYIFSFLSLSFILILVFITWFVFMCIYMDVGFIIYKLRLIREFRRLHPINVKRQKLESWWRYTIRD